MKIFDETTAEIKRCWYCEGDDFKPGTSKGSFVCRNCGLETTGKTKSEKTEGAEK